MQIGGQQQQQQQHRAVKVQHSAHGSRLATHSHDSIVGNDQSGGRTFLSFELQMRKKTDLVRELSTPASPRKKKSRPTHTACLARQTGLLFPLIPPQLPPTPLPRLTVLGPVTQLSSIPTFPSHRELFGNVSPDAIWPLSPSATPSPLLIRRRAL